jgi:hypothetical protein
MGHLGSQELPCVLYVLPKVQIASQDNQYITYKDDCLGSSTATACRRTCAMKTTDFEEAVV